MQECPAPTIYQIDFGPIAPEDKVLEFVQIGRETGRKTNTLNAAQIHRC